ncbi:MAG: gamma-glutamyltransferase family protein [Desulfobacterales bacterium]|nr:gamma-glutamyltransferase family protein [Desulfobacterales bacterium]
MTFFRTDSLSNLPYDSRRKPVLARDIVATSQPLAAQAGLDMLRRGGNAVDAALAAAIALTVVEPTGNGIGSDAFALIWDGRELHGLNGSGRSPSGWSPHRFAACNSMPELGWDSVTVPGAVDAWSQLSQRFGKLPFERLFEPAIGYAEQGFLVTPAVASIWAEAPGRFLGYAEFAKTFLPGGRPPAVGEPFACPQQAETLRKIAATGGETFYRGELAERIAAQAAAEGAALTLQDLAGHTSEWVTPLTQEYHGIQLCEIPPNGQGLTALMALGILRHLDIRRYPVDSADSIHLQVEAMKLAFAESWRHIADPAAMEVDPQHLLTESFLAERAAKIRMDQAGMPRAVLRPDGGTVYLSTADQNGMMVSYIQSNFMGFGSGIVVADTGISLQNRGRGFTLEPGHPNCVGGGKRPFHTITPGFVTRDDRPLLSFGVMGALMQPQGHLQMIVRIFDYGLNPQAASDALRWYVAEDFRLALEPGLPDGVAAELAGRGHRLMRDPPTRLFGGAQLIACLPTGYCGASDHRKDGQAVGF